MADIDFSGSSTSNGSVDIRVGTYIDIAFDETSDLSGDLYVRQGTRESVVVEGSAEGSGQIEVEITQRDGISFTAVSSGQGIVNLGIGRENWSINRSRIPGVVNVSSNPRGLEIQVDIKSSLADTLREMRVGAERVDLVKQSDGSFRAVDRSRGDNQYHIGPAKRDTPPYRDGIYLLKDYDEEQITQQGDTYRITMVFVHPESRESDTENVIQETASGDEWLFEMANGTFATRRVEANKESGTKKQLATQIVTVILEPKQALAIETSASYINGYALREVPESVNQIYDTTEENRQLIYITVPPGDESTLETGEYLVKKWEGERVSKSAFEYQLTLSEINRPDGVDV